MLGQTIDFGVLIVAVGRCAAFSWNVARLIGHLVRILAGWQARRVWGWCDDMRGDIRTRGWRVLVTSRPSLEEQLQRYYQLRAAGYYQGRGKPRSDAEPFLNPLRYGA